MTEPDEDITQLSSRRRGEAEQDDATLLSSRQLHAAQAEEDATLLSSRQLHAAELEEDGTVLASRSRLPRLDDGSPQDDATVLSRRGGPEAPTRPQRRERSPLPPGAVGGAAAQRGSFGAPPEEYEPREIPLPPAAAAPPVATPVPEEVGAPAPREMRRRREAARHRRLITTALVFGITAAVMTAAIIGIIALVKGS